MGPVGIVVGTFVVTTAVGGVAGTAGVKTQATVAHRAINTPNLHWLILHLRQGPITETAGQFNGTLPPNGPEFSRLGLCSVTKLHSKRIKGKSTVMNILD